MVEKLVDKLFTSDGCSIEVQEKEKIDRMWFLFYMLIMCCVVALAFFLGFYVGWEQSANQFNETCRSMAENCICIQ